MWKIAAWLGIAAIAVGGSLLLLEGSPFTPVDFQLLSVVAAPFIVGGLVAIGVDAFRAKPRRWIIFDDDGLGGWLFSYLYIHAQSKSRICRVVDPGFTLLLEDPIPDTAKDRNSFMCTLEEMNVERPREIEMISIGHRSLRSFGDQIKELIHGAGRLTWVLKGVSCPSADEEIAAMLAALPDHIRDPLEIWIVVYQWDESSLHFSFPQTRKLLSNAQITILTIPLSEICGQSRAGFLSETAAADIQQLKYLIPFGDQLPTS